MESTTYKTSQPDSDKRISNGPKKSFIVTRMYERHHEISRRLLLGQKNVEIAEALNITAQSVSQVRNSPIVKEKLSLMAAARDVGAIDLAREIADLAPIALSRIKDALESGKVLGKELSADGILRESNKLLDRELGRPTQTINTRNLHAHLTMDDISKIKAKALELSGALPNAQGV